MSQPPSAPALPVRLLPWIGVLAVVVGLVLEQVWRVLPSGRFGEHLLIAVLAAGLAWPLARWRRWPMAAALACVFAVALAAFAGVLPVLATVLLALAALGLGAGWIPPSLPARAAFALLAGLAVIAAVVGWLLPVHVHGRIAYAVVLVALVAWRRRAIAESAAELRDGFREAVAAAPTPAALAVLMLGLASTTLWLPTLQFDDLAYHLGLPWQLQQAGFYRLDPLSNVWTLAPWAGDVVHAIAQVLAGSEARGAVNAIWLLLTARLLWALAEGLGLEAWARWSCVLLYASQPLTSYLGAGMQAEGPTTAVVCALALAIQRSPERPDGAHLRLLALLAGFALALKASNGLLVLPLGIWQLWRWRGRLPWRSLPVALLLGAFVCGSSYAYAAWLTGNPLFPLFNGVFQSPYYAPVNFDDLRWHAGFDATLPWRLTFDTEHYLESWDGAAGFVLVGLAGALPLALLERRARPLLAIALLAGALVLSQLQYVRYIHPAMALLLPALVAGVARGAGRRGATALLLGLALLNLSFHANTSWILRGGALKERVRHGREALIASYAPERVIAAHQRDARAKARTLTLFVDPQRPLSAELGGDALTTAWYDPQLSAARAQADAVADGSGWRALFARVGATHVVLVPASATPALRASLTDAVRVEAIGDVELWRLPVAAGAPSPFVDERDLARRLLPP
jgi:hypothetical protein